MLLDILREASIVALLSLIVSILPLGAGAAYAIRPTEQRLALMRPVSLAGIFAALCGLLSALVNLLRLIAISKTPVESRFLATTRMEPAPPPGDEQAMVLWQAVQGLPPRQRAVLVLRFHEDMTEAEVARLLGLPLGTVKSLAHRGLARLRDRLGSPDLDPTTPTRREAR